MKLQKRERENKFIKKIYFQKNIIFYNDDNNYNDLEKKKKQKNNLI